MRLLQISLCLIAVVGLAGSTVPVTQPPFSSNQGNTNSIPGIQASQNGPAPQIVVKVTSVDSALYQPGSEGSQQFRQTITEDSEGILYEDYRSRRGRFVICIEIAKQLSVKPLALTDLALLTRVNFSLAKVCLDQMMVAGLVQGDPSWGARKYTLTAKGKMFLESADRAIGLFQTRDANLLPQKFSEDTGRRTPDTY